MKQSTTFKQTNLTHFRELLKEREVINHVKLYHPVIHSQRGRYTVQKDTQEWLETALLMTPRDESPPSNGSKRIPYGVS
jgi:hypothetical protein